METFEELVEKLVDRTEPSYSRRSAISGLARLGDKRAVEPLVSALQDEDRYLRREVVKSLGEMGYSEAVEPLVMALQDSDEYVRRDAIEALGAFGDERAIEPLKQMAEDQSFLTRSAAEKSLRKIEERLKLSAPIEEREAVSDLSSSAAKVKVEAVKEIPPAQDDTAEGKPKIPPIPTILEATEAHPLLKTESAPSGTPESKESSRDEALAVAIVEEAALPEISTAKDSSGDHLEETEERVEQAAEAEPIRRGLHAVQRFTDAEERLIRAQTSRGSETVVLVRFEKDGSSLHTPSFCPGEVMRGKMLLHVPKPFKARRIYLSVKGREEIEWKQRESLSNLSGAYFHTVTYHDEYPIIDKVIPVLGGQWKIQAGNYECPFEFRIPEYSTPFYHGEICTCEYSVSACIDVPLGRDVKSERSFRVSRPSTDREGRTRAISFSTTHPYHDITLSVTLKDNAFPIGSRVKGAIALQNHTKKKVRGIGVELFYQEYAICRYRKFLESGRKRRTTELQADKIRVSVPKETIRQFRTGFSLKIPESASETGPRHLFSAGAFVKVNLDIAREFDVNCFHGIDILPAISPR